MKRRAPLTAVSVRLGVATLKVTRGVGCRVNEVREDMVMARGVLSAGFVAVQTTTECGRRRMRPRSCSESARSVVEEEAGW